MEDSVKKSKGVTKKRRGYSVDELNAHLDSLTAQGEYMLVRGSDREYETIVGHIRYIYVKDEGYDTPIDSSKHRRLFNR